MGRSEPSGTRHEIDPRYDDPRAYGTEESHYGRGRYPPDWAARRRAVWKRQQHRCGRCGIHSREGDGAEVHHLLHLGNGGGNQLDNLVGLCIHCHALMHPTDRRRKGTVHDAPVFPDEEAEDVVAVVRTPYGNEALATDLDRLAETSRPGENRHAITAATVPTSPETARRAGSDLHGLLVERGYVPRSSPSHRVRIVPLFTGLRGAFTSFDPIRRIDTDGTLHEPSAWSGGVRRHRDVRYTADATYTTVEFEDGTGATTTRTIRFPDDAEGARLRIEKRLAPPPFTLRTAPEYVTNAVVHLGVKSLAWGLLPGLLLAALAPGLVPLDGSLVGTVVLMVLVGLLLRLPRFYRERSGGTDRVIDERRDAE